MGRIVSADFAIVVTTVDSEAKAEGIAQEMIDRRLAACVQISPVRSFYVWNGRTEDAREFRLDMKICAGNYDALEAAIKAMHPYETPEILRIDIAGGYGPYLDWLADPK
jgi:periplasmic divalent cation tolerance protein